MIEEHSLVVVCLINPREQYWGRVQSLTPVGLFLRGLAVNLVEEWAREIAGTETPSLGLATLFFPLGRVEKIYLDEKVGSVPAVFEAFETIVGSPVDRFV